MSGGAITAVRVLEPLSLPAPVGIVFRDLAAAARIRDGLVVTLEPEGKPELARKLAPTPGGVWTTPRLPGPPLSSPKAYRVVVHDALGRFQTMALTAELPHRGLLVWDGWSAHPPSLLAPILRDVPPLDPPQVPAPPPRPEWIPLFSAPSRTLPGANAEIRCQIVEADGRPAAWALVTASVGGQVRGLGLADDKGRALIHFAYPPRGPATLPASPPGISQVHWDVDIAVYREPLAEGHNVPKVPALAAILAQLSHPRTPLRRLGTADPLGPCALVLGQPLTIRTQTPQGPSSSLVLETE
jgi:hypothetical protein